MQVNEKDKIVSGIADSAGVFLICGTIALTHGSPMLRRTHLPLPAPNRRT